MSLSKYKVWYSYNCLQILKRAVPLTCWGSFKSVPIIMSMAVLYFLIISKRLARGSISYAICFHNRKNKAEWNIIFGSVLTDKNTSMKQSFTHEHISMFIFIYRPQVISFLLLKFTTVNYPDQVMANSLKLSLLLLIEQLTKYLALFFTIFICKHTQQIEDLQNLAIRMTNYLFNCLKVHHKLVTICPILNSQIFLLQREESTSF